MTERPQAPYMVRSELPRAIEHMRGRAFAKLPEQRYQSANELLMAFKNAFSSHQRLRLPFHTIDSILQQQNKPAIQRAQRPLRAMNQLPPNPAPPKILPVLNKPDWTAPRKQTRGTRTSDHLLTDAKAFGGREEGPQSE
jgi:hypothetical protein